MNPRRGPIVAGEKIQFTDRKGKKITDQLTAGGVTQTEHGIILHDDVIGRTEGVVVTTVTAKREAQVNADHPERDRNKPWKATRAIGGWQYAVMRPRLADYVLSMPRGAQIMYPKDIAQVIQLGDIRSGLNVLESGAGSGAMSVNLLDAVGESGRLTTIELRPEFARVADANATLYYGERPQWWDLKTGDFDSVAAGLPEHSFDRIVLDMLDPWNRLEQAYRVIAPGGVLIAYITTTTQMSRLVEALREAGHWTDPAIQETLERTWKAQGLAVRPDHAMIGHTGFLVVSRAMARGSRLCANATAPPRIRPLTSIRSPPNSARPSWTIWSCATFRTTSCARCCATSTCRRPDCRRTTRPASKARRRRSDSPIRCGES